MLRLGAGTAYVLSGLLLLGCAASETRSVVSPEDIPSSKYRKIAVFIENLDQSEATAAEQTVVAALQEARINALSSSAVFRGRDLNPNAQAMLIRKHGFDAVLYLTVLEKGVYDEPIPNASFDGESVQYNLFGVVTLGHNITDLYTIGPDGSVYKPVLVLKTRAEIQDVKSAKQVWVSETLASGHARLSSMNLLFSQAAKQIVSKMREDKAI